MPNQVRGAIKEERSAKLIELSNRHQEEQNRKYMGKELEVLFEEPDGDSMKGHTSNYMMVYVKSNDMTLENTIRKVKITDVKGDHLIGSIEKCNNSVTIL